MIKKIKKRLPAHTHTHTTTLHFKRLTTGTVQYTLARVHRKPEFSSGFLGTQRDTIETLFTIQIQSRKKPYKNTTRVIKAFRNYKIR